MGHGEKEFAALRTEQVEGRIDISRITQLVLGELKRYPRWSGGGLKFMYHS